MEAVYGQPTTVQLADAARWLLVPLIWGMLSCE